MSFNYPEFHTSDCFQEMLPVVERFVSVNGEGKNAGRLSAFIRFPGCNLSCSYCDTKWANASELSFELISIENLVSFVVESGVRHVTLTGGEPTFEFKMKRSFPSKGSMLLLDTYMP